MLFGQLSALLALIPQPYRTIIDFIFSLIAVCSGIVALLPASAQKSWVVKTIRFISLLVHPDEDGTIKIPFTNIVLKIGAIKAAPAVAASAGTNATPPTGNAS